MLLLARAIQSELLHAAAGWIREGGVPPPARSEREEKEGERRGGGRGRELGGVLGRTVILHVGLRGLFICLRCWKRKILLA
jgi:hypothetical protein